MNDITALNNDPVRKFQEQIANKMRESIADLIPDEILKEMVNKVIKEDILKVSYVDTGRYYSGTKEPVESVVVIMIRKELKPLIFNHVQDFFKNNKQEIAESLNKVFEKELGEILVQALAAQFNGDFFNFKNMVMQRFYNEGRPLG